MRVQLCGVRGSTPAPGREFMRYGGHTSCVAVTADGDDVPTLILDAGTGIRQVTPLLGGQAFAGSILLTHLHWDHTQGMPFFRGGDREDACVRVLLPEQLDGRSAEAALAKGMSPPQFPVAPGELRGVWSFTGIVPGRLEVEGFTVEVREIPHKGGRTFGYRVSDDHSAIGYSPDHCPTVLGSGPDGWGEYHRDALEMADGVDLLLHDAHLVADELAAEAYFGHAACDYAVALAGRAGAKAVVLFHHKPDRTDEALDEIGRGFESSLLPVTVGAEGTIFEI